MTEDDRFLESYIALMPMVAGLTATPTELNVLHGSGLAAADVAQLAGVRVVKVAKVALGHADTGGGVLAWQAPADCFVERVIIDVTTIATGACTLDVGTTATNATTSSNNLLTGLDVHSATGAFDNYVNPGASGTAMHRLASGKWITASKASGTAAGLAGYAYVHWVAV